MCDIDKPVLLYTNIENCQEKNGYGSDAVRENGELFAIPGNIRAPNGVLTRYAVNACKLTWNALQSQGLKTTL